MGGSLVRSLPVLLLLMPVPGVHQEQIADSVRIGSVQRVDSAQGTRRIRILAVGDVNLGRSVGQKILSGDTLYPFAKAADTLRRYDLVFANLESTLSDQGGETVDPANNVVFTGPPAGAEALAGAGIGVVSTANNHALDYGLEGMWETIDYLQAVGVRSAGTSRDTSDHYRPACLTRAGITIAVFACTDLMNGRGKTWKRYVDPADTLRLFPALRAVRDSVDLVIVSYHGGEEYAGSPSVRTLRFMRAAADAGADIVLGHHPHVSYGVERYHGKVLVPSLGNFVFYQPQRYWAQRSIGVAFNVLKDSTGTHVTDVRCLPVRCGYQPEFLAPGAEADSVLARVQQYSPKDVEKGS
jgi:poly-gamma-glutamate capsule biosynthesis protein CapA/YwtB (metallophosphatase superfamily)